VTRPIRIANVSGFYGDRITAPTEMLAGPDPIDVLTGDYLAELTMLILWKARRKDPSAGFATTFLRQMEAVLGTCVDRGVKVVANAGGLNPSGLGERLAALGTGARIAVVEGDDVSDRFVDVVTANAYLGGWEITEALAGGADVVVTGLVTDAALVTGPAAWWHGWARDDWDRLAGAVAAGHVIECGPQATGGNYAWAEEEIPVLERPGFPIAEVADDGSAVITKQPGTGGVVSVGTVTAQLLYEIGPPAYLGPDVTTHFDAIRLDQEAPDRVRISGTRGSPPPDSLKVACNRPGGWRNSMTMVVPGLDPDQKARRAMALLAPALTGLELDVRMTPAGDALHHLTVTVKSPDREAVDRRFSNAVVELALAGYAGFHTTTPPSAATEYGVYEPRFVERTSVAPQVRWC
jgi:hypothetical protein